MEVSSSKRSPREALKRARRDVHHQHLIEAAERVFSERGYDGTRMQDVAQAAGLALATVYGLVGGKEELYAEVHKTRGRALIDVAARATVGAKSAFEALLAGVHGYTEYLLSHPDYLRLHLQESQPWALSPRFTTKEQSKLWREGLELTVEMFRAAIADGSVVFDDPRLAARLMIAAHQVFLGEWVNSGMKELPHEVIERMKSHIERCFS